MAAVWYLILKALCNLSLFEMLFSLPNFSLVKEFSYRSMNQIISIGFSIHYSCTGGDGYVQFQSPLHKQ